MEQPILGLTNIPQDIHLTLSSGTLTLKAGSKVYFPNGVGVFDEVTINSDISFTLSVNRTWFLYYVPANNTLTIREPSNSFSGTTPPTAYHYMFWYDTANNLIKNTADYGSTWFGKFSFPLAIITVSGGAISSIDMVFNGFGYIGSTRFILPGVEGFYPNGFDGLTRKFTSRKNNNVVIGTDVSPYTNAISVLNYSVGRWEDFSVVEKLPNVSDMVLFKRYYSKADNKVFRTEDGSTIIQDIGIPYAYYTTDSSSPYNVSYFQIKTPFLSLQFDEISDYSKYLSNLLIIQYNDKPKATNTIKSIGQMFPIDLMLSVRDGFDIDTATGKQLDILSKYIVADRNYTDSNNNPAVLTDEEFRILLKLKIIVNCGTSSLYGLETSLYDFFNNGIRVVEDKDAYGNQTMSITYYIRSDWANIGLAAIQQDILPHPMGVGFNYNLAAQVKYFGFIEYTDLSHQYSTGFRDYNDPTKQGEMYSYDKVIG